MHPDALYVGHLREISNVIHGEAPLAKVTSIPEGARWSTVRQNGLGTEAHAVLSPSVRPVPRQQLMQPRRRMGESKLEMNVAAQLAEKQRVQLVVANAQATAVISHSLVAVLPCNSEALALNDEGEIHAQFYNRVTANRHRPLPPLPVLFLRWQRSQSLGRPPLLPPLPV